MFLQLFYVFKSLWQEKVFVYFPRKSKEEEEEEKIC